MTQTYNTYKLTINLRYNHKNKYIVVPSVQHAATGYILHNSNRGKSGLTW